MARLDWLEELEMMRTRKSKLNKYNRSHAKTGFCIITVEEHDKGINESCCYSAHVHGSTFAPW